MKKINNVSFEHVTVKDGFWKERYDINKEVSVKSVYERFEETGRVDSLRYNWTEGKLEPHKYYDSDVAKWIEAVSYLIIKDKDGYAEEQKLIDSLVERMAAAQLEDGYLNSRYVQVEPELRFKNRDNHELYTAGHLVEAAIAYHKATGKRAFLDVIIKNMECVERDFIIEKTAAFTTGGHEELELALIKLYDHTGDKKYLDMCMFFLNNRGVADEPTLNERILHEYDQSHLPVREQSVAVGHAVRAAYLYTGMTEAARRTGTKDFTMPARGFSTI